MTVVTDGKVNQKEDLLVIEEPLTVRYAHHKTPEKFLELATLLRTPGDDISLACGFLFAEGYLTRPDEIEMSHYCEDSDSVFIIGYKKISKSNRPHLTHSGCGSCALENISHLYQHLKPVDSFRPSQTLLTTIKNAQNRQPLFELTGGTHATVLFNEQGETLNTAEDVGRHNTLDKTIGDLWRKNTLEQAQIAWVSGRLGFELVQKCINANIGCIISVGAPTSLAINFAKKFNMCTICFSRSNRLSFYT